MFCSKCGKEIPDNSNVCSYCGTNLYNNQCLNKETYNVYSIIGFAVSCASFFIHFFGLVSLAGIIVSVIGIVQCNNKSEKGKVFSVIGIVLGALSFILQIFLLYNLILLAAEAIKKVFTY